MKKGMKYLLFGLLASGTVMVLSTSAWALTGNCVDCHTMHNSQGGASITGGAEEPNLLRDAGGCLGCHAGTNLDTADFSTDGPKVHDAGGGVVGESLAGGNFGWVDGTGGTDVNGHNVADIEAVIDATLGLVAPGGVTLPGQLSCSGTTTGCHQAGGHHNDSKTAVDWTSGGAAGTSYRFLMPLASAQGVDGYEDPFYEAVPAAGGGITGGTLSATVHNQYKGTTTGELDSISNFCAACHGDFHGVAGASGSWERHPTDIDLNTATGADYTTFNGDNSYSTAIPVGSTDISAVLSTVNAGAGTTIVTCLSCHQAHASQYADALRFDYTAMNAHAGASNVGCFVCHSTKDD